MFIIIIQIMIIQIIQIAIMADTSSLMCQTLLGTCVHCLL